MLHTHAVLNVRVPLSHPVFRTTASEGMSGSPPPDTVVVEGVVDGAKADDPSKAKDRHKKHKKHSKKHHKSSKSKSAKDGEREHNGHTAGTSPRDVDADRESGEIEGAPQATDLSPSNAVEPISTPRSADRDSRCVCLHYQ